MLDTYKNIYKNFNSNIVYLFNIQIVRKVKVFNSCRTQKNVQHFYLHEKC